MVVDKIYEGFVVCELSNGQTVELLSIHIDGYPKEGDLLYFSEGAYYIDEAATAARKQKMQSKLNALFQRSLANIKP